ncbi:putative oxidoreductase UxuB [Halolactibacillus miurensis]|uniref:NAD(P)-dependent dehydrogenase, short-chain alcohol dehydrogenase family n=1 Tax=Halolactibacillus miurensis TaxID=306541 RepID=A0A1I6TCA4_9BACI|nr:MULTISPECIES: SDR family oxidoreductase [Halolactibacillus]GEM04585.1 putative oxidoreductase UxuB [Halolactibacillus miurensis]SFS86844.1 NAD(P)-dependent dehydrogenase, short-chain alcohol dehydrogenase family [Halolactibacillus miurensis]
MLEKHHALKGKVAVVTGGGGVLCGNMARALGRQGMKIAVLNYPKEPGDIVASEINDAGGEAISVFCDVTNREVVEAAKKEVLEAFGQVDLLINGAGGNHPEGSTTNETYHKEDVTDEAIRSFFDLTTEGFDFVFRLNLMGTLIPSQVFTDELIKTAGSIINMSSMSAPSPMTKVPAYSAAKAGIDNFTQWMAVHFGETGIRVNAIAPGFFLTEQNRSLLTNEDGSYTERTEKILSQTPMKRLGEADDLLGTLLWLIDKNYSGFVTGISVPVDGGFMAYAGV